MPKYALYTHEYFMNEALKLAQRAFDEGEIPVGAVVVADGKKIIGKGYNQTEKLQDVTAHAEVLAISAATQYLGAKYLRDCTLYVTLEPCVMCAGAIFWSQVDVIVFGASDEKRGFRQYNQRIISPNKHLVSGILSQEAELLLKDFFQQFR